MAVSKSTMPPLVPLLLLERAPSKVPRLMMSPHWAVSVWTHSARMPRHTSKYARGIAVRLITDRGSGTPNQPLARLSAASFTSPRQAARKTSSKWTPMRHPKFAGSSPASAKLHFPSPLRSSWSQAPSTNTLGGMHDMIPPVTMQTGNSNAVLPPASSPSCFEASFDVEAFPGFFIASMKLSSWCATLPHLVWFNVGTLIWATSRDGQHCSVPAHAAPRQQV
mmetsp:Transcript_25885/g.71224  ORF Transcript_25885/g.71224 Transcript_25885/m.71224 type:complete len:222 (-) Transcript_25885:483-1148(-)